MYLIDQQLKNAVCRRNAKVSEVKHHLHFQNEETMKKGLKAKELYEEKINKKRKQLENQQQRARYRRVVARDLKMLEMAKHHVLVEEKAQQHTRRSLFWEFFDIRHDIIEVDVKSVKHAKAPVKFLKRMNKYQKRSFTAQMLNAKLLLASTRRKLILERRMRLARIHWIKVKCLRKRHERRKQKVIISANLRRMKAHIKNKVQKQIQMEQQRYKQTEEPLESTTSAGGIGSFVFVD
eukprot:TRINITY_DN185_c0_g1_i1.p1 TRINITY_DN185_c0_g1~~TRINITY_DN185_c0_g1_i1.p1  ORF type:complete len:236 (-),score=56.84 TRINITY_DN185_c0_g1_i1:134-841(-)